MATETNLRDLKSSLYIILGTVDDEIPQTDTYINYQVQNNRLSIQSI